MRDDEVVGKGRDGRLRGGSARCGHDSTPQTVKDTPRAHLKKSIVEGVCGVRVVVSSLPRKALREANFLADLNAPHN